MTIHRNAIEGLPWWWKIIAKTKELATSRFPSALLFLKSNIWTTSVRYEIALYICVTYITSLRYAFAFHRKQNTAWCLFLVVDGLIKTPAMYARASFCALHCVSSVEEITRALYEKAILCVINSFLTICSTIVFRLYKDRNRVSKIINVCFMLVLRSYLKAQAMHNYCLWWALQELLRRDHASSVWERNTMRN